MPQQEQKTHEKRAFTTKPQDEEYELYLFWPSLSSRDVSSGSADPSESSSPLYGPVSLHSESTEYDISGLSSGPPSPITFAPTFGCRVSTELDGTASPDSPEAGAEGEPPKEPKSEPAKYSSTFKLGLILSMTHLVYSAIDGVKIKMRKPRS